MPFQKGRKKTGGRVPGSKTKINQDITALLNQLGCNPIEGMARIAIDEKVETAIRFRAYAEVTKYVHPQLQRVEHRGVGPGGSVGISVQTLHILESRPAEQLDADEPR